MNKSRKKSEKYKRLLGDTLIFAIGNLGSKIILFFMVPLYTKCLTTEEYGTADLVFSVAQLLVPFVSLVIFDAVLRFGLSKDANTNNILKSSFLVLLAGSVVTILLTPLFRFYVPLEKWRWYLCIYVILTMTGNVELNYLKLINRNKSYAVISIIHTAVLAGANVLFLSGLNLGIQGYLLSTILSGASTVIMAFFAGKIGVALKEGRVDKALLKEMVLFSSPLILNNVSWWVIQSSDKIMVEAMVGAAALGLYTAATKIPSLINVLISIFSQAWGISSVREFESSNDSEFYNEVFSSYSALGFGAAIVITAIAKPFMSIYVSKSYSEAWKYVPLLLTSAAFSAVASYFGSLYGALKKSVNNMRSTLTAATINIVVNYVGIRLFGTWGAIIGTVAAYIVLAFYRMIDVLRYIRFDLHWHQYLINCAIVLTQAIFVSGNCMILPASVAAITFFVFNNRKVLKKFVMTLLNALGKRNEAN